MKYLQPTAILLMFLLAMPLTAQDNNAIDKFEAQQIANDFFAKCYNNQYNHIGNRASIRSYEPMTTLAYQSVNNDYTSFYVFNNQTSGFVLVSGRTDMPPILGYSNNGSFDIDSVPDNFLWLLNQYSNYSLSVNENTTDLKQKIDIEPLIKTKWNQTKPYNYKIPSQTSDYPIPTGCTPTAYSQIMKYYEYPLTGIGSNSYYDNGMTIEADFENTTYDWGNMLNEYKGEYSQKEIDAVSTLIYHAGVAMNTKFRIGGSSTLTNQGVIGLIDHFGYDKNIKIAHREYFKDDEWFDLIYNELLNGRPILYDGFKEPRSKGHSFIIHGYDASTNLFAINWGWSGRYDGYYALTGYNPLSPNDEVKNYAQIRGNYLTDISTSQPQKNIDSIISSNNQKIFDNNCDKAPELYYTLTDIFGLYDIKGVCADGKSQLVIKLKKGSFLPSDECGFEYKWKLSEEYGKLSEDDCPDRIIYTAPDEFPGLQNDWSYTIKATVNYSNGDPQYDGSVDVDITIIRVPVIMIHGLNASSKTWASFHSYLEKSGIYKKFQLYSIDYSSTNCSHFEVNSYCVHDAIKQVIDNCLHQQFIASKCDLVGHSMGGILARLHVQNNYGATSVNKIITVNTPHSGSQLGDIVTWLEKNHPILTSVMLASFSSTDAIRDLAVNSNAIDNNLNSELSLERLANAHIPIHAIETRTFNYIPTVKYLNNPLLSFILFLQNLGLGYSIETDEGSDLVVSVVSQRGGLSSPNYSHFEGLFHLDSPDDRSVQERILSLLRKKKADPLFSQSGFHPVDLSYSNTFMSKANLRSTEKEDNDLYISISNDSDSIYIEAGTKEYDYYSTLIMFGNKCSFSSASNKISCPIPTFFSGNVKIFHACRKDDYEPLFIDDSLYIENARTSLQSFDVEIKNMIEDNIQHIVARCYWKDGTESEDIPEKMTGGKDIVFYENGVLTANKAGSAEVTFYIKEKTYRCSIIVDSRGELNPLSEDDLYHGNNTNEPGFIYNQSIVYNIKPNEGGDYATIIGSKVNTTLENTDGYQLTSYLVNHALDDNVYLRLFYQPYNLGLNEVSFYYGVMLRNVINGETYYQKGSSSTLKPSNYIGAPIATTFNTSLLRKNGIYEVRPAYSVDEGQSWIPMLCLSDDEAPTITVKGSEPAKPVSLPITITVDELAIGKTTDIRIEKYFRGTILFSSSNPTVAEVTPNGQIVGLNPGKSTISIYITNDDNYFEETKTLEISVIEHNQKPLLLDVTKNKLKEGETAQIVINDDYNGKITYQPTPSGIVKVMSDGKIIPLTEGRATIIASSTETYDYYPTVNAITIDVIYEKVNIESGLVISKKPTIGTENVISEGDSKMSVYVYNNTDYTIRDAVFGFKSSRDDSYYNYRYWKTNLAPKTGFTANFDLFEFKNNLTPGKDYYCYFYKDIDFSQPMNIPLTVFHYGKMEDITIDLDVCSTISLPFDAEIPNRMKAYDIRACYNNTVVLNEVSCLNRNHSYIICGESNTYTFTGIPIPIQENPRYGFMTGIHNKQMVSKEEYVLRYDNEPLLKKLEESENRPYYSAYISLPDGMPEQLVLSQLKWSSNNVEATNISVDNKGGIYSIDGRKLLFFEKGINILRRPDGAVIKVLIE